MEEIRLLPLVFSSVVFLVTFWGILAGRVHRAIASVAGAAVMVVAGTWMGFYSEGLALRAVDFNTIGLLFGMMVLVGLLGRTGAFSYLALRAAGLAKGNPFSLFLVLSLLTAALSSVLDNVTTIIVVGPVSVAAAEALGMNALPLLMGEALLSNVGGVATLIGDPPNILIGSAGHLSFVDIFVHLAPIATIAALATSAILLFLFRHELRRRPTERSAPARVNARVALRDPRRARGLSAILAGTIVLYVVHASLGLTPGGVAVIGAAAALLYVRPPVQELVEHVHWDVLVFFVGLFVVVGGVSAAGALDRVADALAAVGRHGAILTALAFLWGSALLSAVVDNVPLTVAMIPVVLGLAARGLEVRPLWWALALGAGLGGNATPVGSSAGVVALSLAERRGAAIPTRTWLRYGLPATIVSCAVASVGLVIGMESGFF